MSRPKGSKNIKKNNSKPKINVDKLTCTMCGKTKSSREFYKSFNSLHMTGKIPYCQECLKGMCLDSNGNIDIENVKKMLRFIDRPFIYDLFKSSAEDKRETIGCYFTNLGLPQNRYLGWKDSILEPQLDINEQIRNANIVDNTNRIKDDFNLTEEIIDKWGEGYEPHEYQAFERKWKKLIDNYGEKTSFHVEALITYIRFRVKEEIATANGDIGQAKSWGTLAKDAALAAKINVSQLSKADLSGGVELVPQLFEAVESEVGIISILPKLKEQPYDDADLIIWTIINYYRRLEDKPRVKYRDIWNFYDEMLEEHFKSQGCNKEQIEKEKGKRNNNFRDLEEVYKEPVYEEGE